MKKFKKIMAVIFAMAIMITAIPMQADAAVKLNATKKTLYVGEQTTLKVTGTKSKIKWSTSNKKVATVTQKGKVTAKSEGSATIKAMTGKKTLSCKITVKEKDSSFSYSADGYKLKYLYYELGENSSGEECVITYWEFTNKSGESVIPYWSLVLKAYQNGVQLTPYSAYDDKYSEVDLCYNKNVKNGAKVKVGYMHKIDGKSPVSFEISPKLIYSNTKIGKMTIKIKE